MTRHSVWSSLRKMSYWSVPGSLAATRASAWAASRRYSSRLPSRNLNRAMPSSSLTSRLGERLHRRSQHAVIGEQVPGGRDPAADQLQLAGRRAVQEPPAGAGDHRPDHDAEDVDDPLGEQRLRDRDAAVHRDVAARPLLELADEV